MEPFRFRLDRVLAWRAKQSQIEENRLVACLEAHRALEGRFAQFQAERLIVERDLLEKKAIPAAEFVQLARYRLRAQRQEIDFKEQRRNSEKVVFDQRARVQQAQQRVKLLEKMKSRRLAEYRYAFDKELETVAAEAHLSRWSREHA